jgi:hypothetical protein
VPFGTNARTRLQGIDGARCSGTRQNAQVITSSEVVYRRVLSVGATAETLVLFCFGCSLLAARLPAECDAGAASVVYRPNSLNCNQACRLRIAKVVSCKSRDTHELPTMFSYCTAHRHILVYGTAVHACMPVCIECRRGLGRRGPAHVGLAV